MFVRAEKGKGLSVIYHRNDGAKLIRTGGTPAWRNTNPGNIRSSKFAKENGSIGDIDRFAVFPDYETAHRALARLLRGEKYRNLSVFDAIQRIEGWKPGTEELIPSTPITAVQRNKKGVIVAYQVQGKGWLSKPQLITLIEDEGGVDAVVVHPPGRSPYIRMRPDSTRSNNLNPS